MRLLHITNGDTAADLIKNSIFNDTILAWRDILFEGPVPGNLDYHTLSVVRARYLSDMHYGSYEGILQDFRQCEKLLLESKAYDEVVLWFEHDLHDQLQLIQLLNWFSLNDSQLNLQLISINDFPGIELFLGLGQLTVAQLETLFDRRQPVSTSLLALGHHAWQAFTSNDPTRVLEFLKLDSSELPFLKNAFIRYLQEFPAIETGLSKTEFFILNSLRTNTRNLGEIFQQLPIFEGARFMGMGDASFFNRVKNLANANKPLLKIHDSSQEKSSNNLNLNAVQAEITPLGLDVLDRKEDFLNISAIDHWLGGVHLTVENCWRWDDQKHQLLFNTIDR